WLYVRHPATGYGRDHSDRAWRPRFDRRDRARWTGAPAGGNADERAAADRGRTVGRRVARALRAGGDSRDGRPAAGADRLRPERLVLVVPALYTRDRGGRRSQPGQPGSATGAVAIAAHPARRWVSARGRRLARAE